jgi:hypothetical protein
MGAYASQAQYSGLPYHMQQQVQYSGAHIGAGLGAAAGSGGGGIQQQHQGHVLYGAGQMGVPGQPGQGARGAGQQ